MKGTKVNRDRKNGASREQWQKRKAAANAARPQQQVEEDIPVNDTARQEVRRWRE